MKKQFLLIFIFLTVVCAVFSQNTANHIQQLDHAVKELAANIHKKFIDEKVQRIAVDRITYSGTTSQLGTYWINQLISELTNIPNRPYVINSGGTAEADWTITGEIIDMSSAIRVFTRLVRSGNRAVESVFQSDFERTSALVAMLSSDARSSSSGDIDEWEEDSFDNPVPYEIGSGVINRSIHNGNDEDFFLIIPASEGLLVMETTGNTDTFMELYDADTRQKLSENDDGGQNTNARIRYSIEAGHRYIVKIRGYNRSTTGNYGFLANISVSETPGSSWQNPVTYELGINENAPVINRQLADGDEDFFLLVPEKDGQLVMETTGRDLDTLMVFYDAGSREELAENDDGGQGYNALIRHNVEAGKRYMVKISGYDGEGGQYGFRAYLQVLIRLEPDEYENDDEPSRAGLIEIGKTQQHTFHNTNDVDWLKFQVRRSGRHTISVSGVNSNRLDTFIELFDANLNPIAEDDDGGENLDSRLSLNLESGLYYLKVWCLNEPNQPYKIIINEE